jgi:predicted P-loop ATPase
MVGAPAAPKPPPKPERQASERGEFVPVVPVPAHAPPPPAKHPYRGDPQTVWTYRRDGEVLGYVYRFVTSDGGKEVLPLTWCESQANHTQKWTWKGWDEPRPLYLPGGSVRPLLHRLVVEGEKCADAAHQLLGDQFECLSWPGGGKATGKADWSLLGSPCTGQRVYLWPDCDSKRRNLTAEEKAAEVSPDSVDYKPAHKQPGYTAMQDIAARVEALGYEAWVCPVERPGVLPDGWDIADALGQGWTAAQCRAHLDKAVRWVQGAPADVEEQAQKSRPGAGADTGDGGDGPRAWRVALIKTAEGAIKPVRENVVLALQSLPEVVGKIAFNEFANDIIKLEPMPWGSPAGKWSEVDELLMGEWLCRAHWLPSMPRGTLEEAVRMVATREQYHPVRKYLQALRHDGTPRLNSWLARCVCRNPATLTRKQAAYLGRVGAWMLMGMVARALHPGCKFDYMPILEGSQGMRKSTLLNILAGEWFADTGFMLGDKDSLQMLQGRWLYEISELDAMARAEVTKIKAFVASKADWYRASFDKRPREYPRQLIFAGTTNEHQYLVDGTGNRRFWPVEVSRVIDTEWVEANRDQLFAEAVFRVLAGERYHPTSREELELFLPQQRERMVESPIEMRVLDYLVNNPDGMLLKQVQIVTLLAAIHIDITKLGPGRFHEKQAGTALKKFGWERKRSSAAGRPWVYLRPENWPDSLTLDDLDDSPPIGSSFAPQHTAGQPAPAMNHPPGAEPPNNVADDATPF